MREAWNARRGRLRSWYLMHVQKSQGMDGFIIKPRGQLPAVLSLPVPCAALPLSQALPWGSYAGTALLHFQHLIHPPLCSSLGLSVLPLCMDSPSWTAVSPLPLSDPLLWDVLSKTITYETALPMGIFANALFMLLLTLTMTEGGS